MLLTSLKIEHYRGIKSLDLALGETTVLVAQGAVAVPVRDGLIGDGELNVGRLNKMKDSDVKKNQRCRVDAFVGDGAATYDNGLFTIEYVLLQTVDLALDWQKIWLDEVLRKRWVHRLANLVPLTQKRNSKAQNYDFAKKKSAYFGGKHGVSSYVLTTQVLNASAWTPAVVEQRQSDLIDVLSSRWDLK